MSRLAAWSVLVPATACLMAGCGKSINNGQSAAYNSPVPDGHIVLVRRSNEFGAFVLSNQTSQPETTDYTWFYRADNQGRLDPRHPAVQSGHVTNATRIDFQSFSIGWSINTNGRGWVYFSKLPTEFQKDAGYEMCITSATNLAGLDAAHRAWRYQTSGRIRLKPLIESQFN